MKSKNNNIKKSKKKVWIFNKSGIKN